MLLPSQRELVLLGGPVDAHRAGCRRQGPVLGGVRRKLMQEQRKARHGAAADRHLGSADDDALAIFGDLGVGREDRRE